MTDRVLDLSCYLGVGLVITIRLENRVPAEHVFTAWWHNLSIAAADKSAGLVIRTFTEGKDALAISRLVIEVLNHFPESFTADISQEVLAVYKFSLKIGHQWSKITYI